MTAELNLNKKEKTVIDFSFNQFPILKEKIGTIRADYTNKSQEDFRYSFYELLTETSVRKLIRVYDNVRDDKKLEKEYVNGKVIKLLTDGVSIVGKSHMNFWYIETDEIYQVKKVDDYVYEIID